MNSREKDQSTATTTHRPYLSSLVVRPTESDGDSDYEPEEVRRDPPYSRSDRFHENSGYGMHAGSSSPMRYRKMDRHYYYDFDHLGGSRGRGFRGGRGPGRFRDSSPPYGLGIGSGGGRSSGRDFDGPGYGPGPFRGESAIRNNPNVSPREGDWICPEPSCGNLNFARREYCNNCNRLRFGPGDSPRRSYPGPPPLNAPPPRFSGPPMDRSPGRGTSGYRSPPRSWGRDGPRMFGAGPPYVEHEGRFPDRSMLRERPYYREEEDYRRINRFDRLVPPDWLDDRDRGRDSFRNRGGYGERNERRPLSPPLPPPAAPYQGRWRSDLRDRSRSPMRGPQPPKDYRRDGYVRRGQDDRCSTLRERLGDAY